MAKKETIGKIGQSVKIAAGLFWADYGNLGGVVRELEQGGADWIHLEMRDGKYMDFAAPRGGIDIVEGIRPHTNLEIEAQLQMMRPSIDLYRQLKDAGADLITLPIETTGEMLIQHLLFIKETLGLKGGVWAWQGTPITAFEQYIPLVDIVEYECKAPFWKPTTGAQSPHTLDEIMFTNIGRLHRMLSDAGVESNVELMEDGGLNADNVERFVKNGMTVGEFSSPLMKGPNGKFQPGEGDIARAVGDLRNALDTAAAAHRTDSGLKSPTD